MPSELTASSIDRPQMSLPKSLLTGWFFLSQEKERVTVEWITDSSKFMSFFPLFMISMSYRAKSLRNSMFFEVFTYTLPGSIFFQESPM